MNTKILSTQFYTESLLRQIAFDLILLTGLTLLTLSVFIKEGTFKTQAGIYFSISIALILHFLYLTIIIAKSFCLKNWLLFLGSLTHAILIGALLYWSMFFFLVGSGVLGVGTSAH